MTFPGWMPPVLIGFDVLVVIYGSRVAITEKKTWGGLLAVAFLLFGIKEALTYNGVGLPVAAALAITVAGVLIALAAFWLFFRALPS